jgi:hypothetical protein
VRSAEEYYQEALEAGAIKANGKALAGWDMMWEELAGELANRPSKTQCHPPSGSCNQRVTAIYARTSGHYGSASYARPTCAEHEAGWKILARWTGWDWELDLDALRKPKYERSPVWDQREKTQ